MSSELRFAILGCGNVAQKHAEAISEVKNAQLTAVVDINLDAAKEFGKSFDVRWYKDIDQLLSKEKVDVITVATPSGKHYAQCMDILRYKKDMIVEKPITLRLVDANNLLKEANKIGVKVFEVKQYRFHPAVQKLYKAITEGRFGRIVFADARTFWCRPQHYYEGSNWRGTWAEDGGVFMNQAIHHIDLLQWLVGPVESVYARGATMLSKIEAEDVGCAFFKFTSGALGVVEATTCARPVDIESSISILGEKGSVVIGGYATNQIKIWNFLEKSEEDDEILKLYSQPSMAKDKSGHKRMYQDIVECLCNYNECGANGFLVDLLKARMCVELMNAIYESIEIDQEIELRFRPKKTKLGRVHNEDV